MQLLYSLIGFEFITEQLFGNDFPTRVKSGIEISTESSSSKRRYLLNGWTKYLSEYCWVAQRYSDRSTIVGY